MTDIILTYFIQDTIKHQEIHKKMSNGSIQKHLI